MSEAPVKAAAVKRKKKPRTWPAKVGFALILAVAVLYGLPSLFVPLGPEQAELHALSRNWSAHHVVPYVAVCDHHAPGLHFLYLMSVMLFGARDGAILLFELLGILAIGVFTAVAAARRKLTPLEIAPLLLVSVVIYFTGVAASDSARGELWAALCVLAGQATISADTNRRKAAIVTGLWIGLALVVRPETVLFIPILFAQLLVAALAERPEPERWPTVLEIIAAFLVGMVQPPAAFSTYFTTRGAASAFRACALRLSALTQLYTDGSGKLASARDFALQHGWAIGLAVAGWVVAFFARSERASRKKTGRNSRGVHGTGAPIDRAGRRPVARAGVGQLGLARTVLDLGDCRRARGHRAAHDVAVADADHPRRGDAPLRAGQRGALPQRAHVLFPVRPLSRLHAPSATSSAPNASELLVRRDGSVTLRDATLRA